MKRFFLVILFLIFPLAAFAYIDPGTGSLWLQYLIGGVASLYFFLKVYFQKLKAKFFSKNKSNSNNKNEIEEAKNVQ
jgi:hypothetical protein